MQYPSETLIILILNSFTSHFRTKFVVISIEPSSLPSVIPCEQHHSISTTQKMPATTFHGHLVVSQQQESTRALGSYIRL